MVQPIMKDVLFLGQKSEEATDKDKQIVQDLKDTLEANRDRCVGMAANMIGIQKKLLPFMITTPLSKKLTCSKANSRRYHRN